MQMDHPAAAHRLALGVPATVEHAPMEASALAAPAAAAGAQRVAETTQNFITLMDALKLQMRAKDQLHPLLSDVLRTYAPRGSRDGDDDARARLLEWCVYMLTQAHLAEPAECERGAGRCAVPRGTMDYSHQMLFDIEHAYTSWFQSLPSHGQL